MKSWCLLVFFAACLAGCSGSVKMRALTPNELNSSKYDNTTDDLKGMVFYLPGLFEELSATTTRVDDKGNVTHRSSEKPDAPTYCYEVEMKKIVTRADYDKPRLMYYDPALLESYKFGMNFNDQGMLTAFNSEGTPDRGQTLKNLADAAGALAPIGGVKIAAVAAGAAPPCNGGVSVKSYTAYSPKR